jgi:serine/threonine-protein kinase
LEAIVRKALERDPAQRYQSAEELGSALSRWIANQGRLITERDIAAVVNEALGKSIAERAQRIASAESELDAPPPPPPPTEQTLGGSSATTSGERALKSKRIWWALAAGGAAAVIVGSFTLGGGHDATPSVVASAPVVVASAAPSAGAAAAATTTTSTENPITVTLLAYPPRAALYLDDGPALPNPYQLTVLPDSKAHQVRASAPGFADRTADLRLDASKELRLTLSALPPGTHAPTAKPKASADATHTSTPVPTSGDLPKVVTKRPRILDPDNPFSAP